ncbi:hypothetical protein [Paraburkholderia fungorum]|uniref:Uncharacterized protein n=1 Tax=Paraburkholderia fungorum TaxID=134537 RepID=A0A420GTA9_9BURK|nr:hypothetical protein [Paraburkholderia fungorum]RKF48419.1 hypothetical protein BCY88_22140 [Paraburkholderia fungorum]
MEVSTQYLSASARTMAQDTLADQVSAANARPAQPKVFPEANVASRFATIPNDRLATWDPGSPGYITSYGGARLAHPNDTHVEKEHGGATDACAKSAFRECRGGEALEAHSSSYVQFDQFDHRETAGKNGRGTCEGIIREALRRIDRNYGGETSDLRSAVINMRGEMNSGRSDRTGIYGRIKAFESQPRSLALSNYRESSDADLNPHGRTSREDAIDGLTDSLSFMRSGGLAYISVGIRRADAMDSQTSGHALLLQHLPPVNGSTGSPDRYTIFDPNNGAFTYDSLDQMQSSLRDYMKSAYTEDGNIARPNTVQLFTPPSSREWESLPATTSVPGRVGTNTLEPPEVMHHPHTRSDSSRAKTDNQDSDETSPREKRGSLLGKCVNSEFRECRGGEALKESSASYVAFDQNDRRETRGDDGRGTCEGIVREAMRRIDRSYSARAEINLSDAVASMENDMRTSARARESGIFNNIDIYQHNRNVLALRIYEQSKDLNFNANGPSSREDRLKSLTDGLNAMSPGGVAFVGVHIQTGGAAGPGDNGHVILIQRRHDVTAPDGTPPAHRYIIFDPNNGAFDYDTPDNMNAALRNYMDTAYTEIDGTVTPDRAIFYTPRRLARERPTLPPPTVVPPSLELPEPPGFMQPYPGSSHTELKKRSPPSPQQPNRGNGYPA